MNEAPQIATNDEFARPEPTPDSIEFFANLTKLINCHSMENHSNTPDYMLAGFLSKVLKAFGETVKSRDEWYDWKNKIAKLEGENERLGASIEPQISKLQEENLMWRKEVDRLRQQLSDALNHEYSLELRLAGERIKQLEKQRSLLIRRLRDMEEKADDLALDVSLSIEEALK